jgi:hypothetical protein
MSCVPLSSLRVEIAIVWHLRLVPLESTDCARMINPIVPKAYNFFGGGGGETVKSADTPTVTIRDIGTAPDGAIVEESE